MRAVLLSILLVCGSAAADKPADRARAFASAQLAAMSKDATAAVTATFTADAVLLGMGRGGEPAVQAAELQSSLMNGSPHSTFKKATIKSIVAGGNDTVVWFTAEIDSVYDNYEPEGQGSGPNTHQTTRLTELIVKDGATWKSVAAVLDHPASTSGYYDASPIKVANSTKAGPLAPLLASPSALIKQLSSAPGTFVLGTARPERGIGVSGAKKLLGRWTKLGLQIEGDVREVGTKDYAFAQASVRWKTRSKTKKDAVETYKMVALLIAIPAGDGWSVVAVHYANE